MDISMSRVGSSTSGSIGKSAGEVSSVRGDGDTSTSSPSSVVVDSGSLSPHFLPTLIPLGTSISLTTTTLAPISPAMHSSVPRVRSSSALLRPTSAPESATPSS